MNKPNYIRNSGKEWKSVEKKELKQLAKGNTPTRVIGLKLGRTPEAIYTMAHKLKITLEPPNQSPYNRLKKK